MDLKQIEYIVKIYEEKNITKAAEKLFITQSALNQQLLKLEKEIGIQLFYRSRIEVTPTKAGDVYIEYGRKILNLKKEAYNKINDITEAEKGQMSIGFTPGRGITMFSAVFPEFHREHPNIQIEPVELSVKEQIDMITKGNLDIGFVTFGRDYKVPCNYEHIMNEDIMLAIPKNHNYAVNDNFTEADISLFKEDNFVLMYKNSTMRELVDDIFKKADFKPKELFETSNSNTIVTMIKSGICCGILPYYYIKDNMDFMNCYYLKDRPFWNVGVIQRKGAYLSKGAKDFIKLVKNYFSYYNNNE